MLKFVHCFFTSQPKMCCVISQTFCEVGRTVLLGGGGENKHFLICCFKQAGICQAGQGCQKNVACCSYFKIIYLVLKDGLLNAFGIPSPAPASGWTSNSIKPSGTTAPSQKFATPPQLTEQDTLVQRAEHIPAGKRTPMCAQCNQVIRFVSIHPTGSQTAELCFAFTGFDS